MSFSLTLSYLRVARWHVGRALGLIAGTPHHEREAYLGIKDSDDRCWHLMQALKSLRDVVMNPFFYVRYLQVRPRPQPSPSTRCTFQIGTIECTGTGLLWDADTDGWDENFNDGPCPQCNTDVYLRDKKHDAESTSYYSAMGEEGTGLSIWLFAVNTAITVNREATIRALRDIGVVNCACDVHGLDHGIVVPIEFGKRGESLVMKKLPYVERGSEPLDGEGEAS